MITSFRKLSGREDMSSECDPCEYVDILAATLKTIERIRISDCQVDER